MTAASGGGLAAPGGRIPTNLKIGTSSWSCTDWVGAFYPPGMQPAEFLAFYASRFDTVEVDSTFYRSPTAKVVDGWRRATPEGFVFCAKVPQVITHEKGLVDCDAEMNEFLSAISRLGDRLGCLLLQFPYFARGRGAGEFDSGEEFRTRLGDFLGRMPKEFRFAVDLRNERWLRPDLLATLREHRTGLALLDYYTLPSIDRLLGVIDPVTSDFLYVRLLGNHRKMDEIVEKKAPARGGRRWCELVVDRSRESALWVVALQALCPRVPQAMVFVNNHYAGFAPGSIDLLRSLFDGPAGRTEGEWTCF